MSLCGPPAVAASLALAPELARLRYGGATPTSSVPSTALPSPSVATREPPSALPIPTRYSGQSRTTAANPVPEQFRMPKDAAAEQS
jgi:hypothetical protein